MNTYQKCLRIRSAVLTGAGEAMAYGWSPDFAVESLRQLVPAFEKDFGKIDPSDISGKESAALGFGQMRADSPVRLIPLWLAPFISGEVEVESITGEKSLFKDVKSLDHRGGFIAYGVVPGKIPLTGEAGKKWSLNRHLMKSVKRGDGDAAILRLLAEGADPNFNDEGGDTPLHAAVFTPRIYSLLLKHGADEGRMNAEGFTPPELRNHLFQ